MYLLKELSYEPLLSKFRATNGLQVLMRENSVTAWPGMWGETEINLGIFADISKFEQLQKNNNRDYFTILLLWFYKIILLFFIKNDAFLWVIYDIISIVFGIYFLFRSLKFLLCK